MPVRPTHCHIVLEHVSDFLRSDHCDIHRFFSVHLLYSGAVQGILTKPICWYLRWGYYTLLALLYEHQDSKPPITSDLSTSDPEADDLLLLSREGAHHPNHQHTKEEEQALAVQLFRRHM